MGRSELTKARVTLAAVALLSLYAVAGTVANAAADIHGAPDERAAQTTKKRGGKCEKRKPSKQCKRRGAKRKSSRRCKKGKFGRRLSCLPGGGGGAAKGDFDGNGFGDLAVGIPLEDVSGDQDAGAVQVFYGSADGLTSRNQFLTEDSPGAAGESVGGDRYGTALAAGDFNGDGRSDLAIGVPGENLIVNGAKVPDAGRVHVINGSPSVGLDPSRGQQTLQQRVPESGDAFGASLVWANFGGSVEGDLAVGAPLEDVGGGGQTVREVDAGQVDVLYGGLQGLRFVTSSFVQDVVADGTRGGEDGDMFGSSLAAGNFGRTAEADLAVGVPFEDASALRDAGAINVIYGDAGGLTRVGAQLWTESELAGSSSRADDRFGFSLAAGHMGRGGTEAELAVGVPLKDVEMFGIANSGTVQVMIGSPGGLDGSAVKLDQSSASNARIEAGDQCGSALSVGDFNGDGVKDLAVGAPFEDVEHAGGVIGDAGAVTVHELKINRLFKDLFLHQPVPGGPLPARFPADAGAGDLFGRSLTAWDFGKGFADDLAVGAPLDDVTETVKTMPGPLRINRGGAGAVNVFYTPTPGALLEFVQLWSQETAGVLDNPETADQFGFALY